MIQLVQPNLSTVGQIGWCLSFVENVFGTPHLGDTATDAFNSTQFPHLDRNFPSLYIPIWFSYFEGGVNYGHVAVLAPDGRVLSSPYAQENTHVWFSSIDQCASVLNCKYLGWSEDLATVRIVKGATMIEPQTIISTFADFHAGVPTADQITYYGNHPNGYDELHTDMAKYNLDARLAAEKQVADLTAANIKLTQTQPQIQQIPDPSVTVTQTGLWAAFKKFLGL